MMKLVHCFNCMRTAMDIQCGMRKGIHSNNRYDVLGYQKKIVH